MKKFTQRREDSKVCIGFFAAFAASRETNR